MLNIVWVRQKQPEGFTLLELMVAVAIVAILVAVAVPGYYNHMVRSRQSAVIGELMSIRAAQEQYFADNGYYSGQIGNLPRFTGAGTYHNGDYEYWVVPSTVGWVSPTTIADGTIWALGDPNHDGAAHDRWSVSIGDLSAKPQHDDSAGSEGFSWSSMAQIFKASGP